MKERKLLLVTVYVPLVNAVDTTSRELTTPSTISMVKRYRDALLAEIDAVADAAAGYEVAAVRFTGGVPLLLGGTNIADILVRLRKRLSLADGAEVTVETIPGKLDEHNLRLFPRIGVNRLEFRVPTLVQREHDLLKVPGPFGQIGADNAMRRYLGPEEWGLRLSFGFEGQTEESWDATLAKVVSMEPSTITLGQVTEPTSACVPETLIDRGSRVLEEAGFRSYGDSGVAGCFYFARPGHESVFVSLRSEGVAQLGLGAGTVSLYDGIFYRNTSVVEDYVRHSADPEKVIVEVREA